MAEIPQYSSTEQPTEHRPGFIIGKSNGDMVNRNKSNYPQNGPVKLVVVNIPTSETVSTMVERGNIIKVNVNNMDYAPIDSRAKGDGTQVHTTRLTTCTDVLTVKTCLPTAKSPIILNSPLYTEALSPKNRIVLEEMKAKLAEQSEQNLFEPKNSLVPGTNCEYRTPGAHFYNKNGRIKRPMNAFMVWAREYRSKLAAAMPNATNSDISVRLGQMWADLPQDQKMWYYQIAEKIKAQHRKDFPDWVYQPSSCTKKKEDAVLAQTSSDLGDKSSVCRISTSGKAASNVGCVRIIIVKPPLNSTLEDAPKLNDNNQTKYNSCDSVSMENSTLMDGNNSKHYVALEPRASVVTFDTSASVITVASTPHEDRAAEGHAAISDHKQRDEFRVGNTVTVSNFTKGILINKISNDHTTQRTNDHTSVTTKDQVLQRTNNQRIKIMNDQTLQMVNNRTLPRINEQLLHRINSTSVSNKLTSNQFTFGANGVAHIIPVIPAIGQHTILTTQSAFTSSNVYLNALPPSIGGAKIKPRILADPARHIFRTPTLAVRLTNIQQRAPILRTPMDIFRTSSIIEKQICPASKIYQSAIAQAVTVSNNDNKTETPSLGCCCNAGYDSWTCPSQFDTNCVRTDKLLNTDETADIKYEVAEENKWDAQYTQSSRGFQSVPISLQQEKTDSLWPFSFSENPSNWVLEDVDTKPMFLDLLYQYDPLLRQGAHFSEMYQGLLYLDMDKWNNYLNDNNDKNTDDDFVSHFQVTDDICINPVPLKHTLVRLLQK